MGFSNDVHDNTRSTLRLVSVASLKGVERELQRQILAMARKLQFFETTETMC
jgi:hypothetical protein